MILKNLKKRIKTSPRAGEVGAPLRVRGNKKTDGTYLRLFASTLSVILRRERSELSGESRNIMAILLREINSIVFRFLIVITGFIPVILVQRVTNLVNKLAILLHKYRFSQDCRNASGNDWCWGRGFNTFSQSGRSMIEMLGVLAIIAVLSVGGIAGYSKAMQKWKENKQIEQVTGLIYNVLDLEYNFAADFRKSQTNILDGLYLLKQLNQLPDGITLQNNRVAVDTFGNYYEFVYYGGLCGREQLPCEGMYFFMRLAKNASGITLPAKIQCQNIIKIVSKFDSENYNIRRLEFRDNDVKDELGDPTTKAIINGKSNCRQNSKCFSNISLDEAYNFCKLCESGNCALVLYMGR